MKETYHIHLEGLVQGVGFRPLVYRLARDLGLRGTVQNAGDGLRVFFHADASGAEGFYRTLLEQAPPLAHITHHRLERVPPRDFDDFRIIDSDAGDRLQLLPSPDFALCTDCRREMRDPSDRRYRYAFITCTHCGPRLSILTGLPYDRPLTTMQPFAMCPGCMAEYHNPLDRRHFSQTNSCPACGVRLHWKGLDGESRKGEEALHRAAALLASGGVLAVRGIGGYLLLCDATREAVVWELRRRKHRPHKPFAVLYPDSELLRQDVVLPGDADAYLNGAVAPILLCELREDPSSGLASAAVAPGLDRVGVMLPYAPLLERLAQVLPERPLVATSGNRGGFPIASAPEEAEDQLAGIADGYLHHNRGITIPQDDSVLHLTPRHRKPIWHRRSRGIAPNVPWPVAWDRPEKLLAMGAELKAAFALYDGRQAFLSPYLGDLGDFDTALRFEEQIRSFLDLLQVQPGHIITDMHPDYAATRLGRKWAAHLGASVSAVPHHLAHACASLGAAGAAGGPGRSLCLAWDGTGLGVDGAVWGSEAMLYENGTFERIAHLPYVPHLAGDQMARQPRLSALAFFGRAGLESRLRAKFDEREWGLYHALAGRVDQLSTSSMGRLFDGVASLLGLADTTTFEGQAAMALERLARQGERLGCSQEPYSRASRAATWWSELRAGLSESLRKNEPAAEIALRFHSSLAAWIASLAAACEAEAVHLSGGVFQNALLLDLALDMCPKACTLYMSPGLPPNDEQIAYGQLIWWLMGRPRLHLDRKAEKVRT